MSTMQQNMDASLGTLAATAAETGCPPHLVGQMCGAAGFTSGLDLMAVAGSVAGSAAGSVSGLRELVGAAAEATAGIAGGIPGARACAAVESVGQQAALQDAAAESLVSCAGAINELTAECARTVGTLVDEVCGLTAAAVGCGVGTAAAQLVEGAVDTVTGILGHRNCGLEAVVDVTIVDCSTAVECAPASEVPADNELEPPQPEQPEPSSVDPVHGFDKSGRIPQDAAVVTDAVVTDTVAPDTVVAEVQPSEPSETEATSGPVPGQDAAPDDGWHPDIWTTRQQ